MQGSMRQRGDVMATMMLTVGVTVPVVAGRLRHARFSTTLNVNSHLVETGDRVAADVLARILDEAASVDAPDPARLQD